jgi:hypothetical protein
MSARKHFYQALAISPALMMVFIGVKSRTATPSFRPVSGVSQQANINAYIPLVRQVRQAAADGNGQLSADEARKIAQSWVSQAQRGVLQPLRPAFYEDSTEDNAKSQILTAKTQVVIALIGFAQKDGTAQTTASDLELALQLTTSLKYSDFLSIYTCGTEQRKILQAMDPLIPQLKGQDLVTLKQSILSARGSEDQIDPLVLLARHQYAESRKRQGEDPIPLEESQKLVAISEEMRKDEGNAQLKQIDASPDLASNLTDMPDYLPSLRLATGMERLNDRMVSQLIEKFGKA